MSVADSAPLRVGVGGLGAIGLPVAKALDAGIPGLALAAVSARDPDKAAAKMAEFRTPVPVVTLGALAECAEVVVECAPPAVFLAAAEPAIAAGRILMPLTVTALLLHAHLIDEAAATGARIIVPTGALLGLDAVRAAAEGTVHSVVMITRKPPAGLRGAPGVLESGLDLDRLEGPHKLYQGTVREAAKLFPANVNVAVALSLAGIGVDRTQYEVWADPGVERNTHTITVDSEASRFEMSIAGVPTPENPATGKLTPLSTIAALRGLVSTMRVGS